MVERRGRASKGKEKADSRKDERVAFFQNLRAQLEAAEKACVALEAQNADEHKKREAQLLELEEKTRTTFAKKLEEAED